MQTNKLPSWQTAILTVAVTATAVALLATWPKNCAAEWKNPKLPVIEKSECRQEADTEVCRYTYSDGTWKEVTEPLGTMRDDMKEPETIKPVSPTFTGGVYRDTTEAGDQS